MVATGKKVQIGIYTISQDGTSADTITIYSKFFCIIHVTSLQKSNKIENHFTEIIVIIPEKGRHIYPLNTAAKIETQKVIKLLKKNVMKKYFFANYENIYEINNRNFIRSALMNTDIIFF